MEKRVHGTTLWRAGLRLLGAGGVLVITLCAVAVAQVGARRDDDVVQSFQDGHINWTTRTLQATGRGAPNLKEVNEAAARPLAEQSAKQEACSTLRATVRLMRRAEAQLLGEYLALHPNEQRQIDELICSTARVMETRYYADGGVDVVMQVWLGGALQDFLLASLEGAPTAAAGAAPTPLSNAARLSSGAGGGEPHTGVVVTCDGLAFVPALAPRLLSEAGVELFGPSVVRRQAWQEYGMPLYTKSLDAALRDARVGDRPMILRAARAVDARRSDLVMASEEAAKLTALHPLLADGRIVFVIR